MGLLKKNLIFTLCICVCLLAFAAGAYLAFAESRKIDSAKQQITRAESQLKNMRFADPAPTEANVEAAKQNAAQLADELEKIRADLEQGANLTTSTDGVGVMAAIQQYISEYRQQAAAHTNELGEPAPIELPRDFGFGFEQYVVEATPFEDPQVVAVLDKQRQILSYLLDTLFEAHPASLIAVKREVLEQSQPASNNRSNRTNSSANTFKINPAISAKVPGAIDTLAFSLSFTGYTDSLRSFLNELAQFELPIVVRSIEVQRPSGESTTVQAPRNELDSIFGGFGTSGGSSGTGESAPTEAQKPIISENISTFTVVLEFIEIVLPAESAEDNA